MDYLLNEKLVGAKPLPLGLLDQLSRCFREARQLPLSALSCRGDQDIFPLVFLKHLAQMHKKHSSRAQAIVQPVAPEGEAEVANAPLNTLGVLSLRTTSTRGSSDALV